MRKTSLWIATLALVVGLSSAAMAEDAEELIEKHITARGGREAWAAIESLELTGDFTSFSKIAPFKLQLKRGQKARLEGEMSGHPFIMAHDGETAWHINDFYEIEWSWKLEAQDFIAFRQDLDLATPFFDYEERGFEVEWVGEAEVDGIAAVALKLKRPDGQEETWYFDPETHLEVARDSEGSDFGRPAPQRTFFDDFREVGGVMIPHFTETQWYTRDRIFEVHEVKVNAELDDELFAFPIPTGMDQVASMTGDWDVKLEERSSPRAPWEESAYQVTIESMARGAMLQESWVDKEGTEIVRNFSYDRFRETYSLTQVNGFTTHLDLRKGTFDEEGRLALTNQETGTEWTGFGRTFHGRTSVFNIADDSFQVEEESSTDVGETWDVLAKMTYTRRME